MASAFIKKMARLMLYVHDETEAGRIAWVPDEDGDPVASLAGYRIRLHETDRREEIDCILCILDDNGDPISCVTDVELNQVSIGRQGYSGWFKFMDETFEAARRHAKGEDKAIDDILKFIDNDF